MKKCISFISVMLVMIMTLSLFCMMSPIGAMAEEASELPEAFYPMDESQLVWIGENASLDFIKYDDYYEATECKLYSAAWAGRYGGIALIANGLNITVSAQKNRYLVLNIMQDYIAVDNEYDKFSALYWKQDDAQVGYSNAPKSSLADLNTAQEDEFKKVIIDLGWEEEFILDTLRLEMFSSSYDTAAGDDDGHNCGYFYIEYIALFDTKEQAEAFIYKVPVEKPTTAPEEPTDTPDDPAKTPGVTEVPTTSPTEAPEVSTTDKPVDNDKEEKKSPMVAIVIGVVVVVAIVAVVIILKPKKRK